MLRIGIVAGEVSGDFLGAQLIKNLKEKYSDIEIVGIGGKHLIENGCQTLFNMERLSVTGISEVFGRCFELLSIRNKLIKYFTDNPPDVFIGIDAPDFNLTLEEKLRNKGIKTVHYVSPSVWAWRSSRLEKISRAVDLMLVLFPFELPYYEKKNITARLVKHPLITQIQEASSDNDPRVILGLPKDKTIVALMPGSRKNELQQLVKIFLQTAILCQKQHKDIHFVANLIDEHSKEFFISAINKIFPKIPISIFIGDSMRVMQASDVLLLASGTITLEAMLLGKPMVVAYKLSWITYKLYKILSYIPYLALPNLLAGKFLVPECIQYDCTPEKLAIELSTWIKDKNAVEELKNNFNSISEDMIKQKNNSAADAIIKLLMK